MTTHAHNAANTFIILYECNLDKKRALKIVEFEYWLFCDHILTDFNSWVPLIIPLNLVIQLFLIPCSYPVEGARQMHIPV